MNTVRIGGREFQQIGTVELPAEMAEMEVGGRKYPVEAFLETEGGGLIPLLDIPMMSDFTWQLGALLDREKDPEKYEAMGEDVPAVKARIRAWLQGHMDQATPVEVERLKGATA